MNDQLTETEAQTLAVMLDNAAHAMTHAKIPAISNSTFTHKYAWPAEDGTLAAGLSEMIAGFYDVVPAGFGIIRFG